MIGEHKNKQQFDGAEVCHVLTDQLDESLRDFGNRPQYDHGTLDEQHKLQVWMDYLNGTQIIEN